MLLNSSCIRPERQRKKKVIFGRLSLAPLHFTFQTPSSDIYIHSQNGGEWENQALNYNGAPSRSNKWFIYSFQIRRFLNIDTKLTFSNQQFLRHMNPNQFDLEGIDCNFKITSKLFEILNLYFFKTPPKIFYKKAQKHPPCI